jgi:hypothetical protein
LGALEQRLGDRNGLTGVRVESIELTHVRAERLERLLLPGCGHDQEVRVVTGVSVVAGWPAGALAVLRGLVALTVATRLLSALM